MDKDQMDTRHGAATDETPDQAPAPGGAPRASVAVTVLLVVALWVVIVLVLAFGQIILNRNFGIDFAFGSLPGIWDWVIAFALFMLTWTLVRRRHPKKG
jgi:uncharacterized RDD family membrane protein YckC